VPFTLVHAGKYGTEDKLKIQTIQKVNTSQKKQSTQNTAKQNYPGLVAFYDTRPVTGQTHHLPSIRMCF